MMTSALLVAATAAGRSVWLRGQNPGARHRGNPLRKTPGSCRTSSHGVLPRTLAEECGAELRRPLLSLEVHVDDPEAVAVAGHPLEIIHHAPLKVALHRHAVGGRPLELRQEGAQEQDTVCVVDLA